MNDLVGEKFDQAQVIDSTSGAIQVTLKNAIESPIRVNQLHTKVVSNNVLLDGIIDGLSVALPIELKPNESLSFTVTPVSTIAGSQKVIFDWSGIEILADPKAIWNAIVLPQSTMTYKRAITSRSASE